MSKKSTSKRKETVKVKDLPPAKAKKLTGKQMKKVKGGWVWPTFEGVVDPTPKPGAVKGGIPPK